MYTSNFTTLALECECERERKDGGGENEINGVQKCKISYFAINA